MASDGKQLEALVAVVEEALVPAGCKVELNTKVYNEDGDQMAEFDIEVSGRIGSMDMKWLIECRDRPGQGSAPGAWIEQLSGRQARFRYNKVTAVSTTGFSASALDASKRLGIELREVASLDPKEFASWVGVTDLPMTQPSAQLIHASIDIGDGHSPELTAALKERMGNIKTDEPVFRATATGAQVTLGGAFSAFVDSRKQLFDDVVPNGDSKKVAARANYTNDQDHYVIDTTQGPVRVRSITFQGELRIQQTSLNVTQSVEYRRHDSQEPISQVLGFDLPEMDGQKYSLELHHVKEEGETVVVLRRRE